MAITLKSLQDQVNKLKVKGRNWLIALAVAVVLAIALLFTVFRKQPVVDQSYKLEIERLQDKIEGLERENDLRDSIIAGHDQKLMENRKTETIIKHHYDKIPVVAHDYSRDELRREVSNY